MKPNFLTEIIDNDLRLGSQDHVVTRFPPEPNGYLHIGHAKSICLNAGIAQHYNGTFHLRFDDTNPVKEEVEYVESIQHDVAWLLGKTTADPPWQRLFFASDFFARMYEHAIKLVNKGLAFVDSQPSLEIREQRGGFDRPGVNSPFRDRSIAENLALFEGMRAGQFADGSHVLRAKIDMAHPNMLLRDPVIYRVKHAHHHRTGDAWCIYPMYDFAHCLEDANEGITHSICTLEFESNRALYNWVLDSTGSWSPRPRQHEFARLALGYTVMSKRKLLLLVQENKVDGWDDPRMPTVSGLRQRGVTAEAIRAFIEMVGVAKNNSLVDIGKLEHCIRADLESHTRRAMAVLKPLEVVITNWPAGKVVEVDAPWWPQHEDRTETRKLPLSGRVWIERDDFAEEPAKGFKRLAPGREVRLRHGCVVRCDEVIKDADGEVVQLRCTHDPDTIGGKSPSDRKLSGTIHWVSAEHGQRFNVRLYDRLFVDEKPDGDPERDFREALNPDSLIEVAGAVVEPAAAAAQEGDAFQFERVGYFIARRDKDENIGFWRTITLRDAWSRKATEKGVTGRPDRGGRSTAKTHRERDYLAERAAGDPALNAFFVRLRSAGIGDEDAFAVSASEQSKGLFEAAEVSGKAPVVTAKWLVNVLPNALSETRKSAAEVDGAAFGRLVQLVAAKSITAAAGKDVLVEMLSTGREAAAIVDEKGLLIVRDDNAVAQAVDGVFAANPDEASRFVGGDRKLTGFFIGQVMRAMRGKGDPQAVRSEIQKRVQ
jgi:glutaminyl-tRNA synthetase